MGVAGRFSDRQTCPQTPDLLVKVRLLHKYTAGSGPQWNSGHQWDLSDLLHAYEWAKYCWSATINTENIIYIHIQNTTIRTVCINLNVWPRCMVGKSFLQLEFLQLELTFPNKCSNNNNNNNEPIQHTISSEELRWRLTTNRGSPMNWKQTKTQQRCHIFKTRASFTTEEQNNRSWLLVLQKSSTRQQQMIIKTLKYLLGFFYNIISNPTIGLVKALRWNHTELVWIDQVSYTEKTPDIIIHVIM